METPDNTMNLKSVKGFRSKDEYLFAMKEDLAEWLYDLHGVDMDVDNFFDVLDTGCLLCTHANTMLLHMQVPQVDALPFRKKAQVGSFQARDNLSLFISFCRKELKIPDTLLFESEDLACRKNERSVVLCLLEVGRRGASFGITVPQLVKLEQEIDAEIETEQNANNHDHSSNSNHFPSSNLSSNISTHKIPSFAHIESHYKFQKTPQQAKSTVKKKAVEVDLMTLDEMVRLILSRCTCEQQYPMIRISEGKYTYGDNLTPIFLRVLRRHVMVRTGGGWDTLESFLGRHDPCRCNSKDHRGALAFKNAFKKKATSGSVTHKYFDSCVDQSSELNGKISKTDTPLKQLGDTFNANEHTLHLLNNVKNLIADTTPQGKMLIRPQTATAANRSSAQTTSQAFKRPLNVVSLMNKTSRIHNSNLSHCSMSLHSSQENLSKSLVSPRRPSFQLNDKAASRAKIGLSKKLNTASTKTSKIDNTNTAYFKTPLRPMSARPKISEERSEKKDSCTESTKKRLSHSAEKLTNDGHSISINTNKRVKDKFFNYANSSELYDNFSKSLNVSKENIHTDINSSRRQSVQGRSIKHSSSFVTDNSAKKSKGAFKTPSRPMSARTRGTEPTKKKKTPSTTNTSQTPQKLFFSVENVSTPMNNGSSVRPRKDLLTSSKTKIPGPVGISKRLSNESLKRSDSGVDITGATDEGDTKTAASLFSGKDFY